MKILSHTCEISRHIPRYLLTFQLWFVFAAAVIGFVEDYEIAEGVDLTVSVAIELLEGELERPVTIRVFTMSGSAQGAYDLACRLINIVKINVGISE